jgi:hypothetical protein
LQDFFAAYTTTDLFATGLGLLLLFRGRKLYWLALGGAGFFLGLGVAGRLFPTTTTGLELEFAFLLGIAGAFLAVLAQRMAVNIGGFVLGGAGGLWCAHLLSPMFKFPHEISVWILAAVGAVAGVYLASALFEVALVTLTTLIGAALIASRCPLEPPQDSWLLLVLALVGLLAQSSSGGSKKRNDDDD